MKKILYISIQGVFFALLILRPLVTLSQEQEDAGFAGPDKKTCKSGTNSSQTIPVQIGPASGVSTWCYKWSPSTGLSNPNIYNPMAAPDQTTTYNLVITGDDFAYELTDAMTVTVIDINSMSVSPKQCCFKVGTAFKPDMFNITSNPPGLDKNVTFDPPTAPSISAQQQTVNITVKSQCEESGGSVSQTVPVLIVNEDVWVTVTLSLGDVEKGIKKLDDYCEMISKPLKAPISPCELSKPSMSKQISQAKGTMCCPGNGCAKERNKYAGGVKSSVSYDCDFPIPSLSIPGIAAVNVSTTFSLAFSVMLDYKATCDGGDVCLTGTSELNAGGGISGTILGGKALKASLLVVGQVNTPTFQLCIPSGKWQFLGALCYQVDIVGTVKFLGAYTEQVKFNLVPKSCF